MSGWTGTDLSVYGLDEPITNIESNAIQSTAAMISKGTAGGAWTVETLGQATGIGGFGPVIVGSGEEVADELIRFQDEGDVDGSLRHKLHGHGDRLPDTHIGASFRQH